MKDCVNCRFHETYYTKCAATFCRHRVGYCSYLQKTTENHESCEKWEVKRRKGVRSLHKRAAGRVIEKISSDLSVIAQILTDDLLEEKEEKEGEGAE